MLHCYTADDVARCREEYEASVPGHALEYLARVEDSAQYPGVRCEMGENMYMYRRTASSGNESMNRANKMAHEQYGVDAVVATMILMDLASMRYGNKKAVAWQDRNSILTTKGEEKCKEAFNNIHLRNYRFAVQEMNDRWVIQVGERSGSGNARMHSVEIAKQAGMHGSRFGTCTCGRPKVIGAPCVHMVVAVKLGRVPDLTEENVMPYWWMTAQMRLQFPKELNFVTGMDMGVLKDMGPPTATLYYCPEISAPNKTGRPKNDKRIISALEASGGRGRGRGRGGGRGDGRGRGREGGRGGGRGNGRGDVGGGGGRGRGRGRGGGGDVGGDDLLQKCVDVDGIVGYVI